MPDASAPPVISPITFSTHQKVYFASDFHLGSPTRDSSRKREDKIVRWLDSISQDAHSIFLLGDIFDFWFEYRHVVPKGYLRLLGRLSQLVDQGIGLYLFTGNHDLWMYDYFTQEWGVPIIRHPVSIRIGPQRFYVGHGDGLGPGDKTYKLIKKVFTDRFAQRLFGLVHPDWGVALARRWSAHSRRKNLTKDESFKGKDDEWIYQYCLSVEETQHHDYYIFGHRHLVLDIPLNNSSRYINTGEWFNECHYACYDGQTLNLLPFEGASVSR